MYKAFVEKNKMYGYAIFRILVGLLFLQHGAQKMFGIFGAKAAAPALSLMWFVGAFEFFGGLLIAVGLFTRLAAASNAFIMVVAFFKSHFSPDNWLPIANKGELALVYFACFMVITAYGAYTLSLEKAWLEKELF